MLERVIDAPEVVTIAERLAAGHGPVRVDGAWGAFARVLAAAMQRRLGRPMLLVTADVEGADDAREELETFLDLPIELLAARETAAGGEHPDALGDEIVAQRAALCLTLHRGGAAEGAAPIAVASILALMQPLPGLEDLEANCVELAVGQQRDPQELAGWLADHGFSRLDRVEGPGDFAVRGGIVDVYSAAAGRPVRVEFFGDEIESIRLFDLGTQRSSEAVPGCRVPAESFTRSGERVTSFFEYLPPETLVVLDDPDEIQRMGRLIAQRGDATLIGVDHLLSRAGALAGLHVGRFAGGGADESFDVQSVHRFEPGGAESGGSVAAVGELCRAASDHDVFVYCDNPAERKRFDEIAATAAGGEVPSRVHRPIGYVHRGFCWPARRLIVIGHHELFAQVRLRRRLKHAAAIARPVEAFYDLEPGDYVVHRVHGIARFRGLKTMTKPDPSAPRARAVKREEFLSLEFAGRAQLYVPVSQIDLVQKYVGGFRGRPPLSKLGGQRWKNTTEKVREAVADMAADLLGIQAARLAEPGIAYGEDTDWQKQFEASFPYTETEDQLTAAGDIKADMQQPRPMDRLLCGDVGYGKTELAIRAAFKTVAAGKQVAVLVPTTVLAEQHLQTFRQRLAEYPFVVEALSRFRSDREQTLIVEAARAGRVDVLIGTHRLLSQDVRFQELGLLVIDEEQRFGVEHKERFKQLRATVDVLTMTATPIPRTLHMAMLGLRDISSLATPPLDRRSIGTQVCYWQDALIRQAILGEMNRQGQVYFVHNRVRNIHAVADRVRALVPEARVLVGHGQMKDGQLEDVMTRFVQRGADVLVCTTIIESGIDIPSVNTIFINDADRFGLADLHQLRGRVGRYKYRAHAYLLVPRDRTITPQGARRLKAIEEFSELGAGFRLAMRDLEIRGAGNLLGREQSGHIAAVGYDMYCRLLEQAVRRLRHEPAEAAEPVHIELELTACVPTTYVRSERLRLEIYRRLASARSVEDVAQLEADLADAYGPVPDELATLIGLAEVRVLAGPLSIRTIMRQGPDVVFVVRDAPRADVAFRKAAGSVRLADEHTVHWRPPPAYLEPASLLTVLRHMLRTEA